MDFWTILGPKKWKMTKKLKKSKRSFSWVIEFYWSDLFKNSKHSLWCFRKITLSYLWTFCYVESSRNEDQRWTCFQSLQISSPTYESVVTLNELLMTIKAGLVFEASKFLIVFVKALLLRALPSKQKLSDLRKYQCEQSEPCYTCLSYFIQFC